MRPTVAACCLIVLLFAASSAVAQYQPGIPRGPSYGGPGNPGYHGPGSPGYNGPGRPDFGGSPYTPGGAPSYDPTSQFPDTSVPVYEPQYVEYKYCESCGKEVSDSAAVGQQCPHCGVTWGYDETTGESSSSSGGFRFRSVGKLIGGVIALLFLIGGGIAKAVSR